jgi:hypothetical protein
VSVEAGEGDVMMSSGSCADVLAPVLTGPCAVVVKPEMEGIFKGSISFSCTAVFEGTAVGGFDCCLEELRPSPWPNTGDGTGDGAETG